MLKLRNREDVGFYLFALHTPVFTGQINGKVNSSFRGKSNTEAKHASLRKIYGNNKKEHCRAINVQRLLGITWMLFGTWKKCHRYLLMK